LTHIVQVISHYVPAYRFGGPQHVAHGLGRALVRRGLQVSVLTTNLANERDDLSVVTGTDVDVDGVRVRYHPTQFSRYWGYSSSLAQSCKEIIPTADLVLVHFHYQFANLIGARTARRWQIPYFVFAHGSFKQDALTRKGRYKKWLYNHTLESANLRHAERIIFNADEEKRHSVPFPKSEVLPNGIDPADYALKQENHRWRSDFPQIADKILMLFLGRLDFRGKGLDLLLAAFRKLLDSGVKAHLILAGPDERGGESEARKLTRELSLERDVTWIGMITGQKKLALLSDVDFMVLPSRSEGLSITLLEALYLGIPILVTDQVGMHERVASLQAGLVCPVSEAGVEHGLRQLCVKEIRNAMRGKASEYIKGHHTWDALAGDLLQLAKTCGVSADGHDAHRT
jgi:glycosyltransferase involved in cell wall biosynthesis